MGGVVATGTQNIAKNGTITIDTGAENPFYYVEIKNIDGNAVRIGLEDIVILRNPPDYQFEFDAKLVNADGDVDTFEFTVSIDGNNDGMITSPIVASIIAEPVDVSPELLTQVV